MGRRKSFGEKLIRAVIKAVFTPPKIARVKASRPLRSVPYKQKSSTPKSARPPKIITPEQQKKIKEKEILQLRIKQLQDSPIDLHFSYKPEVCPWATVPSERERNVSYRVEFDSQTCTCKDFLLCRSKFEKNHTSRLCKHLWLAMKFSFVSPETECLRFSKKGPIAAFKLELNDGRKPIIVIHNVEGGDVQWLDVCIDDQKYGWSIRERRWSYGERPFQSKELRSVLSQIQSVKHGIHDSIIKIDLRALT